MIKNGSKIEKNPKAAKKKMLTFTNSYLKRIKNEHKGNIIIYQTKDGQTLIDVRLENETVWINRQQMAELFDRDVKTIGKHITNH